MSSSMRNFVEAYAAVHNTEAKEELTSSRDCISEMNLSDLTDGDLDEIVEQVLEVMFSQGHTVDSAHEVFGEAFEESNITGRQQKIERLCEALNRAFDNIDSKASTVALEEFAKYRNNKKLQESWSARFNQEKRIQRAHDRLVAAESLNVKTQLLKLVEAPRTQKGAMAYDGPNKARSQAADRVKEKTAQKMMKKEEVSQIRKGWGDAYRSIYEKNDGNLANNYPPYDKVTRGDVIAGATDKDQMGGKKKAKMKKEEVESVDEATAMAKRGYDESPIRRKIASQTGGGKSADRATALANKETYGRKDTDPGARDKLARKQRTDFRNTTSSSPGLRGYGHKSNDPKVKEKQAARGKQRGVLTPNEKQKMGESVQFSEAELKAFEAIVNSWED